MNKSTLEDRMALIGDIKKRAQDVLDALENAETVETPSDFDASLDDALDALKDIASEIAEVRSS